jgi:hypothetical protein
MTLSETNSADHANRQRRILAITDQILQHAIELLDLAGELDGIGCTCGRGAEKQPYSHVAACPMRLAWGARQMAMARSMHKAPSPPPTGMDVLHLADPLQVSCSQKEK